MFDSMINEANESSSACRFQRVHQVETSAPPEVNALNIASSNSGVKRLDGLTGIRPVALNRSERRDQPSAFHSQAGEQGKTGADFHPHRPR